MRAQVTIHDPSDTVAYHGSRSLCTYRDMSLVTCANVATAIRKNMGMPDFKEAVPEESALWFYFLNQGKSIIKQKYHPLEPMDDFDRLFMNRYHKFSNAAAIRAFYYLVLICVRESRHVENHAVIRHDLIPDHGAEAIDFVKSLINAGSTGAYTRFLQYPPQTTIGNLCRGIRDIFYKGHFSPGFGGKAWGAIADCLVNFVDGTYTPEMMLDTVWTLCHNNGAIFNKQMFYKSYSGVLYRILDIQRSGQIAEACQSDDLVKNFVSQYLTDEIEAFREKYPDAFGTYVDWYAVEAHGALHGPYWGEKAKQAQMHGLTGKHVALMSPAEKAKIAELKLKAQIAKDHEKGHFEYWPGEYVKKLEAPKGRKVAA
jgi:hypothetical protein